jgi:diguanylate cyclase (GGDEF)-like protein
METRIILVVGSVLLCSGCMGLLLVRLTNPFFKGLGWQGAAFASGALGATIFAKRAGMPADVFVLLADTFILLGYVLMQVSFLELTESQSLWPRLGTYLLGIQAAVYPIYRYFHNFRQMSVVTLGVLVAIQALQSALFLKRTAKDGMGAPVWFSIAILTCFAIFNFVRSGIVLVVGTPTNPGLPNPLEAASAVVYLGAGLGVGFGAFWLTSAKIRIALEGLANTDPLTGIFNRRVFTSLCEQELLRSSRSGQPFSLLMFDLDHFKQINDRYGHGTGDAVLCAVVEKLRNSVRNIDAVGRWGGEEFVGLLPGANCRVALLVAQRLRRSVETLTTANLRARSIFVDNEVRITISIGVATYRGPGDSVKDILHRCDTAMYQAKAEGRNRIVTTDTAHAISQ